MQYSAIFKGGRALKDKLKKLLTLTIVTVLLLSIVVADSELNYIKKVIEENYVEIIKKEDIKGSDPKEIFKKLDRHSEYYTPAEFTNLINNLNDSKVTGIGIYIKSYLDIGVQVTEVLENSPAEKAGLKYSDIIYKVNNIELKKVENIEEISNLIRGPIGTTVSLLVKSIGENKNKEIIIERQVVEEKSIIDKTIKDVGYIKIRSFNKNTAKEFKSTLDRLRLNRIGKLIIDLRGNGGGFLDEVISMCDLLIKDGPVLHIKDKTSLKTHKTSNLKELFKRGNLIVLVDENTASAAEIMALAIQENKLGKVVGDYTVGKGSVQRLYTLESGAGFKLTEAYYLSPTKNIVEGRGVTPDYKTNRYDINLEELKDFKYENNLKINSIDDDVYALEQRLKYYGYKIEFLDRLYDEETEKAIKDIKKKIYKLEVKENKYVPLRDYFEEMGYIVDWDNNTKSVLVKKEYKEIRLPIGRSNFYINNEYVSANNSMKTGNGITYVSGEIIEKILCTGDMAVYELREFNDIFINDLFNSSNDRQLEKAIELLQ